MEKRYEAPWGKSVWIVSLIVSVLLLVLPWASLVFTEVGREGKLLFGLLPLLILGGAAWFAVFGYQLNPQQLLILHPGHSTPLALTEIVRAWHDPSATHNSTRQFGIGGLFCISGRFRNKRLGHYRAWVTDPDRAVVLEMANGEKAVISPAEPPRFLAELKELHPGLSLASQDTPPA